MFSTELHDCELVKSTYVVGKNSITIKRFVNAIVTESYIEGILDISNSLLTNSAVVLSYFGGISSSNFTGSLKMDSQRHYPQVAINNNCSSYSTLSIEINSANFEGAMNGVISVQNGVLSDVEIYNSNFIKNEAQKNTCLLYTSPSPRDGLLSRMPSSA